MEPATGLILILALSGLNAVVAWRRSRSAGAFLAFSILPAIPLVFVAGRLSSGDGLTMGWAAALPALATFVAVLVVANGKEVAARTGSHGAYTRCSFCAEPVRREAIKCRHCGSDLQPKSTVTEGTAAEPLPALRSPRSGRDL